MPFFESNGVKIYYEIEGNGPDVILMHGFASNLELNWKNPGISDALKDENRVIMMDCRGHGKSDKPKDAAQYGEKINDDIVIKVFNPSSEELYENANNESIVMLMEYMGFSVLFTGDAEYETEMKICDLLPGIDILKVGHHGSETSSSEEFLKNIEPRISVVSAGYNNYGHPSKEVLERLSLYGKVYVTKIDGFLEFIIKDDIIYLDKYLD